MNFYLFNMQTRIHDYFKSFSDASKAITAHPELYGEGSIFKK